MYALRSGIYRHAMRIQYGHIRGWCIRCGATEFNLVKPAEELTLRSKLRCAACGALTLHREVTYRIGDEAVRQANDAIAQLKRRYKRQRERLARLREELPSVRLGERPAAGDRKQQVVER